MIWIQLLITINSIHINHDIDVTLRCVSNHLCDSKWNHNLIIIL
jgi:hypothetical protein